VENIYTPYNLSHFTIYLPNLIKAGGNVMKFWQKQKCTFFKTQCRPTIRCWKTVKQ